MLRVRSFIGRSDDLAAGKSYYMVEAEAALDMVRTSASANPHLFIIDELFRGTNASERIAAAEAVLVELVRDHLILKPHSVILATHDGELADHLREDYAPYHLTDVVTPEGLSFDYGLRPGPSTTRNAITLLRLRGAP
jgi:DNA mismatch repair ATPase MutS